MEKDLKQSNKWNPIVTVPSDIELELCVYDNGQYHALAFPCRRNGVGWSDVRRNKMVLVRPTHWRPWPQHTAKLASNSARGGWRFNGTCVAKF